MNFIGVYYIYNLEIKKHTSYKLVCFVLASTYFPGQLPAKYLQRK